VRSIEDFKGCNTWSEFLSAPADVNSVIEKQVPWILATDIAPLSQENPSISEECRMIDSLREVARKRDAHTVRIMPFKWLEAFNITEPSKIEEIRQQIIRRVRQTEAELITKKAPLRKLEGFVVTDKYIPQKRERKVFMYASSKERRSSHLLRYRLFLAECFKCYQLMKLGVEKIPWPPECFRPPSPKLCNAL
jgi:hypothetical protein